MSERVRAWLHMAALQVSEWWVVDTAAMWVNERLVHSVGVEGGKKGWGQMMCDFRYLDRQHPLLLRSYVRLISQISNTWSQPPGNSFSSE